MTRKINLFTILIFAYSIVVCATLRKEGEKTSLSVRINKSTNINSKFLVQKTTQNLLAFKK
jgi:hypothetical protein